MVNLGEGGERERAFDREASERLQGCASGEIPSRRPPSASAAPTPSPSLQAGRRVSENGFTLVELMVVILILGLLTTIVIINVLPAQDRAMGQKAKTDIALLEQAAERYRLDMFDYPATGAGLAALVQAPPGLAHPERYPPGGYIKRLPDDPWGNPYHYEAPGKHGTVDIYSLGADGREGGEGQNADIGNWK